MWVSSYGVLELNDAANDIPKKALTFPIDGQLRVPVEFRNARASLNLRNAEIRHDLSSVLEANSKENPGRRVSTILNQLYTKTCPLFYPLSKIAERTQDICKHCSKLESVDLFFTCPRRAVIKLQCFAGRMGWKERIMSRLWEMLEYLRGKKILPLPGRTLGR